MEDRVQKNQERRKKSGNLEIRKEQKILKEVENAKYF